MITLVALVVLLLVLVSLLIACAVGYAVHRHPGLSQPVLAALTVVGLIGTVVTVIIGR